MNIAAAQIKPFDGDIAANLQAHLEWAERAANEGADLILFPEMSLTGYQRELAGELTFVENDERLHALHSLAAAKNIVIIAGAPVKINGSLFIGAFILSPVTAMRIYVKQFLHTGEEQYFSPGFDQQPLVVGNETVSVAICADITNPGHAMRAAANNTTLYVAGIFYTPGSMPKAHELLSSYARQYRMNVLMANYAGPSYVYVGGGESAYWNSNGDLVKKLNKEEENLLLIHSHKV